MHNRMTAAAVCTQPRADAWNTTTTRYRRYLTIVASIAVIILSSCATTRVHNVIPAFSQAIVLSTANTKAAFETVEQKYAEASAYTIAVNYDEHGFNPKNVQDWLPPEDRKVRLTILAGLDHYATQLMRISGSDQLQQVDSETRSFGDALSTLATTEPFRKLVQNTTIPEKAGAAALDTVARLLIERQRNRELPTIIRDMQEPIRTICNLLSQDIGGIQGKRRTGLREQLWNTYDQLLITQDAYIQHNASRLTPAEKRAEVQRLPAIVREQRAADQTLAQVRTVLEQISKTNEELLTAVTTKQDLRAQVAVLIQEGQRIKDYYDTLGTTK